MPSGGDHILSDLEGQVRTSAGPCKTRCEYLTSVTDTQILLRERTRAGPRVVRCSLVSGGRPLFRERPHTSPPTFFQAGWLTLASSTQALQGVTGARLNTRHERPISNEPRTTPAPERASRVPIYTTKITLRARHRSPPWKALRRGRGGSREHVRALARDRSPGT